MEMNTVGIKASRVFKFRAWDEADGFHREASQMSYNISPFCDATAIMQFTGMQDKNGTDIYEGDIVLILDTDWVSKSDDDPRSIDEYLKGISSMGVVYFQELMFGVEIGSSFRDLHVGRYGRIEIIGNIYQNPKLLNAKKQ